MKMPSTVLGVLLSICAFAFFTFSDTTVKVLVEHYPAFEAMGAVFIISPLVVLGWVLLTKGKKFAEEIRPRKKSVHLWRGFFQFASNAMITFSIAHMSLAEFYVILFLAPIIVALLSGWLLKEKLVFSTGIASAISFIGVLVAVHPTDGFNIWALVAFGGTVMNAATSMVLRKAAETENAISPALSVGLIVGLLCAIPVGFDFVVPAWSDVGIMVLGGVLYGFGQLFLVKAFSLAPAALATVPQFLQLVFGAITGYLVFGDVPSPLIYLGGAIVVGANVYLLMAQNKKVSSRPSSL